MILTVYSQSPSFEKHINAVVDSEIKFRSSLSQATPKFGYIYIVHASSFTKELPAWLKTLKNKEVVVAVAAEMPRVEDLLIYTEMGVKGYCNAYMAATHYSQLFRLLSNGESWYPPTLLNQAFDIARSAIDYLPDVPFLEKLTKRECEIALVVADGKTNKQVAKACDITERTVKAHLTQIFKKLQVKDRVSLIIYLNQFNSLKHNHVKTG